MERTFVKIHPANLKKYYEDPNGNLYYKLPDSSRKWGLIEGGWTYEELYTAITEGTGKLLYVSGPAKSLVTY